MKMGVKLIPAVAATISLGHDAFAAWNAAGNGRYEQSGLTVTSVEATTTQVVMTTNSTTPAAGACGATSSVQLGSPNSPATTLMYTLAMTALVKARRLYVQIECTNGKWTAYDISMGN